MGPSKYDYYLKCNFSCANFEKIETEWKVLEQIYLIYRGKFSSIAELDLETTLWFQVASSWQFVIIQKNCLLWGSSMEFPFIQGGQKFWIFKFPDIPWLFPDPSWKIPWLFNSKKLPSILAQKLKEEKGSTYWIKWPDFNY